MYDMNRIWPSYKFCFFKVYNMNVCTFGENKPKIKRYMFAATRLRN